MIEGARAAVVGHPIGHSRSPVLHRTAYTLLGVEVAYEAIDAPLGTEAELVRRLREEPGWVGLSCTMPMKQPLLPFLDSRSERVDALGALNTVVVERSAGDEVRLRGENTDVDGLRWALHHASPAPLADRRLLVLGAGGTAAASLAMAAELGMAGVSVAARSPERAAELREVADRLDVQLDVIPLTSMTGLGGFGAVISALPPRAADSLAADVAALAAPGVPLLDVAYDPWPSRIGAAWEGAGGRLVHGLSMLVHQAIEQVGLFTGLGDVRSPELEAALCDAAEITLDGRLVAAVAG